MRPDLQNDENKKVLGKFKDEMNSLIMKQWLALNPKVYISIHEHFDKTTKTISETNKQNLKVLVKRLFKIIILTMIMLRY